MFISDSGVIQDQAVDDGIGTSDDETNSNSSSTTSSKEGENSPNLGQPRRVIKLDLAAMSQLLTFDEVRRFSHYWTFWED